jgi:hypothetical protein
MQITLTEAMKFTEKVLFERKKKESKLKGRDKTKYVYPITLVEYNPQKRLQKKLSKLEKQQHERKESQGNSQDS